MTFRPDAISRGLLVLIFLLLLTLTVKEYASSRNEQKFDFKIQDQKFAAEIKASASSVTDSTNSTLTAESSDSTVKKTKNSRKNNKNNKLTISQKIININTAGIDELTTLPGVGPKMAEKILEHRKINGSFKTIEAIRDVKGIGEKKYEKLKDRISI